MKQSDYMRTTSGTTSKILSAMKVKEEEKQKIQETSTSITPSFLHQSKSHNAAHYSTNAASASFTSTAATVVTTNESAKFNEFEYMFNMFLSKDPLSGSGKSKCFVSIETNFGSLNLELFPYTAPRACFNFIMLAKEGRYDNVAFHRLIKNFMIQVYRIFL